MPSTIAMRLLSILSFVPFSKAIDLNTTIAHEYAAPLPCTATRTTWSIVLSCAATLFACTWTAIHPNMPGLVENRVAVCIRRLITMVVALVLPEFVIMWAIRQFFDARVVQKRFEKAIQDGSLELRVRPYSEPRLVSGNAPYDTDEIKITFPEEASKTWSERLALLRSSISTKFGRTYLLVDEELGLSSISTELLQGRYRWTLKHSFYAWMGGFVLYVNRDHARPRTIYHPLTPDELLEYLKADDIQVSMVSEEDINDRSKGDWLSKTISVLQLAWFVVHLAARAFAKLPITQLELDTLAIAILSYLTYSFWWYKPKDVQRPVSVYWKKPGDIPQITYSTPKGVAEHFQRFGFNVSRFVWQLTELITPIVNLAGFESVSDTDIKTRRVPYFCGYSRIVDRGSLAQILSVLAIGSLGGMLFGGLHCIAWNFFFPTYIERALWRMASLTMAVTPVLCFVDAIVAYQVAYDTTGVDQTTQSSHGLGRRMTTTGAAVVSISICLYVAGRLIVMVLMFLTLRSLPAGAYDDVCWTSLIPHL